jgi:hypothetical protein
VTAAEVELDWTPVFETDLTAAALGRDTGCRCR